MGSAGNFTTRAVRYVLISAVMLLSADLLVPADSCARADEYIRAEAARILTSREFRNFPRLHPRDPLAGREFRNHRSPDAGAEEERNADDADTSSEPSTRRDGQGDANPAANSGEGVGDSGSGGGSSWPAFDGRAISAIAALAGPIVTIASWVVIAVIVLLILVAVVQAIRDRVPGKANRTATTLPLETGHAVLTVAPGQTDPERLLRLARELEGQGRYGEAVHQVVLAALSTTERAGLVRFRSGLTLQDYLRALSSSRPVAWNSLTRIACVFEPVFFGNHAASREMVEQVLEDYTEGFEAIDAPHPN